MNRNSKNFDNKKIKKNDFYKKDIKIFNIDDIHISNILVFKKEQYGEHNSFKYFIGYNDNDIITPLYLFISQTAGYINEENTKYGGEVCIFKIARTHSFTSALKTHFLLFKDFSRQTKVTNDNNETINYTSCRFNTQTIKLSSTRFLF